MFFVSTGLNVRWIRGIVCPFICLHSFISQLELFAKFNIRVIYSTIFQSLELFN